MENERIIAANKQRRAEENEWRNMKVNYPIVL